MKEILEAVSRYEGLIQAMASIVAVSIGIIAIRQTSHNLRITRDALYLSTTPTLDVDVQQEKVVLRNPGIESLYDIRMNLVLYKVAKNPARIQARTAPAGSFFTSPELKPGASVELPESKFDGKWLEDSLANGDGLPVRALVITFRRAIDGKKHLHFEPLIGTTGLAPLYSHKASGVSGPWSELFDFVPEIEKKERLMFGTSKAVRSSE